MRSSVPHNHHHHHHHHSHHHHRSSATTMSQWKSSELVLSSVSAIAAKMPLLSSPSVYSSKDGEQRSSSIPNGHIESVREPILRATPIPSDNVGGKDSEEVLGTLPMAVIVSSTSNAKTVYSTPSSSSRSYVFNANSVKISSSMSSGSDSVKSACTVADSSSDSSRNGNVSGSNEKREKFSEIVAAQTTPSTVRRKQHENISAVSGISNVFT